VTRTEHGLLTADHLRRKAYVYVRQSSDFQVRNHVERQRMQYALSDHARELGFGEVEVIDDDQGTSGNGVERPGFDCLLAAVCRAEVGLVLSLEASRLARNGRDWHTLLDFCAIVGCLVGDRQRVYDPAAAEDRLFLGLLCTALHKRPSTSSSSSRLGKYTWLSSMIATSCTRHRSSNWNHSTVFRASRDM